MEPTAFSGGSEPHCTKYPTNMRSTIPNLKSLQSRGCKYHGKKRSSQCSWPQTWCKELPIKNAFSKEFFLLSAPAPASDNPLRSACQGSRCRDTGVSWINAAGAFDLQGGNGHRLTPHLCHYKIFYSSTTGEQIDVATLCHATGEEKQRCEKRVVIGSAT